LHDGQLTDGLGIKPGAPIWPSKSIEVEMDHSSLIYFVGRRWSHDLLKWLMSIESLLCAVIAIL